MLLILWTGTYKKLVALHKAGELDFEHVITFNMDEVYYITYKILNYNLIILLPVRRLGDWTPSKLPHFQYAISY